MNQQLTLGLTINAPASFANFFAADNAMLVSELQRSVNAQGEQYLYLWGAKGAGKTHLLHACCQFATDNALASVYFDLADHNNLSPDILQGLEILRVICLDNIDAIAGLADWEEALFHCFNRLRDAEDCRLLITGNAASAQLAIQLADLKSRLAWGVTYKVQALSDEDKPHALQLHAKARGLNMGQDVAEFVIKRWPRDMSALFQALEQLDEASLMANRKITIPFVKQTFRL